MGQQPIYPQLRKHKFWPIILIFSMSAVFGLGSSAEAAAGKRAVTTAVRPVSHYELGKPFTVEATFDCTVADGCPDQIEIELSEGVNYIRAVSPDGIGRQSFDFARNRLTLEPADLPQLAVFRLELMLVVDQTPQGQPHVRFGDTSTNKTIWLHTVAIFPAAEATLSNKSGKNGQEQPLYLRTGFGQSETDSHLDYTIAPANQSDAPIENLTLITQLPDGVSVAEISSGRFVQADGVRIDMSYRTRFDGDWIAWGTFEDITTSEQNYLSYPPLETGASVTKTLPIQAVKLDIANVPAGFRWAGNRSSLPTLKLITDPTLETDWIEVCTTSNIADTESCAAGRPISAEQSGTNLNVWIETDRFGTALETGNPIIISPQLEAVADAQSGLDLVIELPRWLTLISVTNSLAPTSTVPTVVQRVSPDSGRTQLHWQWAEDSKLAEVTLPILLTQVGPDVVAGVQTISLNALSGRPQTCWGERPIGRDGQDLDQDGDLQEFVCLAQAEIGVQAADPQVIDNVDKTDVYDKEGIFSTDFGDVTTADGAGEVVVVMRNRRSVNRRLNGWIDFNADGRFADDEQIVLDHQIFPQTNPQAKRFSYEVPADAACGPTVARFRLDGSDLDGEDVPLNIDCVTDLELALGPQTTPMGPNEMSHWFLSVTNQGGSPAENVTLNVTVPAAVNYQGLVSLTNDPIACSDDETARRLGTVTCEIAELAAGQGITLSLAYLLPFDTKARSINSLATVSSDTADADLSNNVVSRAIKVEKTWVLQDPAYELFTHISYFPPIVANPDLQELDFKLDTVIASVINVPISMTIGVDTNRLPRLTVASCIENPDDVTCNQTNFIEGKIVQENYGVERIFFGDELIYEPEKVQIVRLNRIADPNLTRCGQNGSCVGFDLFRVGRGDVRPYAWNAPVDYFYLGFFTSGGREVGCPETGYEKRCFVVQNARPGDYEVEGFATINLVFEDTRLGNEPVIVRRFVKFRTRIRVVAPFVEPEVDP